MMPAFLLPSALCPQQLLCTIVEGIKANFLGAKIKQQKLFWTYWGCTQVSSCMKELACHSQVYLKPFTTAVTYMAHIRDETRDLKGETGLHAVRRGFTRMRHDYTQ